MPKELVISAAPHETRVAILEDGQLCEIYIEREKEFALVGSIYKGRVTRVLPGMQSAFVEIGLDSDAFLYVSDFLENLEDYDHVVSPVESKAQKMEQQGGTVFAPTAPGETLAEEHRAPSISASDEAADQASVQPPQDLSDSGNQENVQGPSVHDSAAPSSRNFTPAPGQAPASGARWTPPESQNRTGRPERGPGGFGQGQGRGRDRGDRGGSGGGGNRRGGRWRRGGRSNDRPAGRDLPASKYASPRSYTHRPYEQASTGETAGEPPADFAPLILPGESLAKYKDRAPTPSPAAPGESTSSSATPSATGAGTHGFSASLYAAPTEPSTTESHDAHAAEKKHEEKWAAGQSAEAAPPTAPSAGSHRSEDAEAFSTYQALPEEPPRATFAPRHEQTDSHEPLGIGAELSDEEANLLAEQLAEARQGRGEC